MSKILKSGNAKIGKWEEKGEIRFKRGNQTPLLTLICLFNFCFLLEKESFSGIVIIMLIEGKLS